MSGRNLAESCAKGIIKWKHFKTLTKSELQYLNENRYEATFKPGEILIKQGSPASNVLFLDSGMAKIYMEGISGKNLIISIAMPGRLIIGPGAYVNSRHTFSAAAITNIQACFISFEVFRHLMRENSAFAEALIKDLSEESFRAHNRMISLTQKKMPGRLAETLLYFADDIFRSDEYDMILSRQELGEMTDMAKECVVRILKELEDSGIIYSDSSKIKILDKDKLVLISSRG